MPQEENPTPEPSVTLTLPEMQPGDILMGDTVYRPVGAAPARMVVQIAASESSPVVLCNDGTLWTWSRRDADWRRLPAIPQDKPKEGK